MLSDAEFNEAFSCLLADFAARLTASQRACVMAFLHTCGESIVSATFNVADDGLGVLLVCMYRSYLQVRTCWEARKGSLIIAISDAQIERARHAISRLEKTIVERNPGLDTDALWQAAGKVPRYDDAWACRAHYGMLMITFQKLLPEENITPKDF